MNKKLILTGFAIFISLIFLMAPVASASHSISPASATQTNYQPNPQLNTQATWTTFNSSMAWNEYLNGTGKPAYLNVENGTGNYITINTKDIQAKALSNDKLPNGYYANSSSAYSVGYQEVPQGGAVFSSIGSNPVSVSLNESNAAAQGCTGSGTGIGTMINVNNISSNPNFDYITAQYSFTGPAAVNAYANIEIFNTTTSSTSTNMGADKAARELHPGQSGYFSFNLASLNLTSSFLTNSKELYIMFNFYLPTGSNTYTITINGLSLTTYPISLGMNSTGSQVTSGIGNIHLSNFKPAINMAIGSNGYSENLTQPMSLTNYTTTQTPITSGNYIEQVGYQATFSLPSSPDLSYSASNFTLNLSVPATQIQVLEVNGVSDTSLLGNKTNGTVVLLSTVNPTSTISYLAYVDFTASEWQSISHPAGIFTIAGIEYYWFIAVGAIAGLLGLAGGVRHAHNKAEQTEKVKGIGPRGRA